MAVASGLGVSDFHERERRQYRRGLVLGLTMAEIMVLIIFLLLLALGLLARDAEHKIVLASKEREEALAKQEAARSQLQSVRKELGLSENAEGDQDDLFRELVRVEALAKAESNSPAQAQAVKTLLGEIRRGSGRGGSQAADATPALEQMADLVRELRKGQEDKPGAESGNVGANVPDDIRDAREALSGLRAIRKEHGKQESNQSNGGEEQESGPESLKALVEDLASTTKKYDQMKESLGGAGDNFETALADAHLAKETAQGQLVSLQKQLQQCTGGDGKPPCWVGPNGETEYIFDAALTADGILLRDNAIERRQREQQELPIQNLRFDSPYTDTDFLLATTDLKHWSDEHNCVFYLRVFDEIDNRKDVYKRRKQTVGGHFYFYEMKDEHFATAAPPRGSSLLVLPPPLPTAPSSVSAPAPAPAPVPAAPQ